MADLNATTICNHPNFCMDGGYFLVWELPSWPVVCAFSDRIRLSGINSRRRP